MAKPVGIGSRNFKTQAAALDHFKAILHRYKDGEPAENLEDHADLVALLDRYDPILESVGEHAKGNGQISYFERRLNTGTGWNSSGLWVIRKDSSSTDFSYIDAVKGRPKGLSQDFYNACRQAVALDLISAEKKAFSQYGDDQGLVECELTGNMVAIGDAHLDRAWPYFFQLLSCFRAAKGWSQDIPEGIIAAPADGQTKACFLDAAIADSIRAFHHEQAVLRILSKAANLQTASKARKPRVFRPVRLL